MTVIKLLCLILLLCISAPNLVSAHQGEHANSHGDELAVVPSSEKNRANELLANGPTETSGILSAELVGSMSLDGEFESSDGLVMRVREITLEPGGVIAVHQHDNRPGAAYIIEGEMTEHRSSEAGPVIKRAGDTAMERSGVIHWWENTGNIVARAIIVDIVEAE